MKQRTDFYTWLRYLNYVKYGKLFYLCNNDLDGYNNFLFGVNVAKFGLNLIEHIKN